MMVTAESNQGSAQKTFLKRVVKDSAFPAFVVFLVLLGANFYFQDRFFTYRILRSNFMAYTPLILISMAQAIIIISGGVDFSIGYALSLFTCLTAYFMNDTNVLPVICLGFFVVFLGSGVMNGFFVGKLKMSPLITTFATMTLFWGIAQTILPVAGGYVPRYFYKIYRVKVAGLLPFPVVVLLIAVIIWIIISRTAFGRYIYAVGSNEEGAYASGIKVSNVRFLAHVVASIFIAMAGVCSLMSTASGDFRVGQEYALNSVAAVVIGGIALTGGKGNIRGAILGALILGLINNIIFYAKVSAFYQGFAKGMVIVLALSLGGIPQWLKSIKS
jgi:ribose transport system permease protein